MQQALGPFDLNVTSALSVAYLDASANSNVAESEVMSLFLISYGRSFRLVNGSFLGLLGSPANVMIKHSLSLLECRLSRRLLAESFFH